MDAGPLCRCTRARTCRAGYSLQICTTRTTPPTRAPLPLEGRLAALPTAPGCYLMKDAQGRVIYVGKAKVLRDRVRSYFGSPQSLTPKTQELVKHIADFEVVLAGT